MLFIAIIVVFFQSQAIYCHLPVSRIKPRHQSNSTFSVSVVMLHVLFFTMKADRK